MTDAADPAAGTPAAGATPAPGAAAAPANPNPNPAAVSGDAAKPAGQAPGGGGGPSPAYRPEGLPDHLYGATERETIDKLFKGYAGAREAISGFGTVPEAPEGYAFTPSEAAAPYLPDLANDPFMKTVQASAHKHKIGDKQFQGFIGDVMSGLIEGGQLDDPFSADKERAIIAPDVQDPAERAKAADKAIRDTIAFLDAMVEQKKLARETADWAKGRTDRGEFIRLMTAMRASAPGLAMGGGAANADGLSELDKRVADPRNQFGGPKYEAAFAKETMAMAKRVVGDGDPDRV